MVIRSLGGRRLSEKNNLMTDYDRCGRADDCGLPAGWGTDHTGEGACKHHGGASSGAPEGNSNAVSHGAYAEEKKLYAETFSKRERDLADRVFEDYYGRYVAVHDAEPPLGFRMRLFNIAVNAVTELRVENWFTDKPGSLDTGTPHLDRETHISESGTTYYRYKKSPAMAAMKTLSDYNRQWLKTFGLEPSTDSDGTTVNVNVHEEILAGMKAANGIELDE